MVALAARLKQTTYDAALMHLPMEKKLARGRKPNTRPALVRQSLEQSAISEPRSIEYDDVAMEPQVEPAIAQARQRGRPSVQSSQQTQRKRAATSQQPNTRSKKSQC